LFCNKISAKVLLMKIGIPSEVHGNERRVAITPDVVEQLIKLGFEIAVQSGAGEKASFSDTSFSSAGAQIVEDARLVWEDADIILKVRAPEQHPTLGLHEVELFGTGQTLICFIWPAQNEELIQMLSETGGSVLAMDCIPRISRAQKMDALSSMANIAGYRAIIEAAGQFGRFFTGQITAAGKVPPAKVLVIGAGVAGLAAIGAAKSLGAIVRAFDTRPEVKEQVESMNAEFLLLEFEEDGSGSGGYAKTMSPEFIKAEVELFAEQAREVDIIITTALIPGKPAPKLITADMVKSMKAGSVIVDLAAEQGGNCELTSPDEIVVKEEVTIIGYTDLPSRLPAQASQLYGTNLKHLLSEMCTDNDGRILVDMEDDAIRGATVVHAGDVTWPAPPIATAAATMKKPAELTPEPTPAAARESGGFVGMLGFGLAGVGLLLLARVAPPDFMSHLTVFVLACFVGYQVVWNVTPALHTPLMSVTNAISGIIVIGAILQVPSGNSLVALLASIAVLIATINIAGGFYVTQRMLRMFQKGKN
jgi:NAD(P) transhydrogenase subunit alpha